MVVMEAGSLLVLSVALFFLADANINDLYLAVFKGLGVLGLAAAMALGAIKGVQMLRQGDHPNGHAKGLSGDDKLWMAEEFKTVRHDARGVIEGTSGNLTLDIRELDETLGKILEKLGKLDTIADLLRQIESRRGGVR